MTHPEAKAAIRKAGRIYVKVGAIQEENFRLFKVTKREALTELQRAEEYRPGGVVKAQFSTGVLGNIFLTIG